MFAQFGAAARLRGPQVKSKCIAPRKIRGPSAALGMTQKKSAPVRKSIASPFENTQGRLRFLRQGSGQALRLQQLPLRTKDGLDEATRNRNRLRWREAVRGSFDRAQDRLFHP